MGFVRSWIALGVRTVLGGGLSDPTKQHRMSDNWIRAPDDVALCHIDISVRTGWSIAAEGLAVRCHRASHTQRRVRIVISSAEATTATFPRI